MNVAALLFPDFAMIAIGWLLRRHARWSPDFWAGAEKMVYYVFFPALLFGAIVRGRLSVADSLPMLAAALGALWVGVLLGYSAKPALRPDGVQFASGVQCAFRFNSFMTIALAQRIGGDAGLAMAAVIASVVVPQANLAAVFALARNSGAGLFREIARNPLVLATVSGLAFKSLGFTLPEPVDATLSRLGQASLALGLICVGAGLSFAARTDRDPAERARTWRFAAWVTATKLVAMPLVALLVARATGLGALPAQVAVLFAAMPTAPAAYVLASRMGGDGPLVAWLISVSMLGGLVSLPFWLSLV